MRCEAYICISIHTHIHIKQNNTTIQNVTCIARRSDKNVYVHTRTHAHCTKQYEKPEYELWCEASVTALCVHVHQPHIFVGGTRVGQIVLWDLRECVSVSVFHYVVVCVPWCLYFV